MTEEQQEQTPPSKGFVFRDYSEFDRRGDSLVLPYRGKGYAIPEIGIRTAAILHGVSAEGQEPPKEWTGEQFYRVLLGSAYDAMLADDVPVPFVQRAATTVWTDVVRGRAAAVAMWELGDDPESWAAVMAAHEEEFPAPSKSAGRGAAKASGTRSASRSSSSTSRAAKSTPKSRSAPARGGRTSSAGGSNSKATSSRS